MSENTINRPTTEQPLIQCVHLKQTLSLLLILFLSFFLVPEITHAQQKRVIKQDLFSATFPTEQHGWACGRWGTVLHTDDGGQSWVRQDSSTDYTLSSISFIDPQNGWAVGDGGTIIHTGDGGKSWVKQKCPVDYFLMGVCFVNAQKGWAVAGWTTILHTEDGGKDWQVQYKGDDYILKSVSFCDPLNGWAAGEYGFIYHTSDGGRTWEHQAGSYEFSEDAFEIIGEDSLFNVHAIDPKRAWAVGIDGHIGRTLDGGETWEKVKSDFKSDIKPTQLFGICLNSQEGTIIIGGKSILLTSSDGGKSFIVPKIDPPVKYGWIYGVAPRGSEGFVAVGKDSWIYLGDSKGAVWKRSEISGN